MKVEKSDTFVHHELGLAEAVFMPFGIHWVKLESVVNPYHPRLHKNDRVYFFGNKPHTERNKGR